MEKFIYAKTSKRVQMLTINGEIYQTDCTVE